MKLPDSFWSFNIGHVGSAATIIVAGAIAWANLRSDALTLRRDHDALVIKVDEMDRRGTQASQRGIYVESEHSKSNERRVEELEKEWHEAAPKLARIDANVEILIRQMSERK